MADHKNGLRHYGEDDNVQLWLRADGGDEPLNRFKTVEAAEDAAQCAAVTLARALGAGPAWLGIYRITVSGAEAGDLAAMQGGEGYEWDGPRTIESYLDEARREGVKARILTSAGRGPRRA